jgi:hypothetical protein
MRISFVVLFSRDALHGKRHPVGAAGRVSLDRSWISGTEERDLRRNPGRDAFVISLNE